MIHKLTDLDKSSQVLPKEKELHHVDGSPNIIHNTDYNKESVGFNACLKELESTGIEIDVSIMKKIAIDALKCETNAGIPYKKIRIICDAIAQSLNILRLTKIKGE